MVNACPICAVQWVGSFLNVWKNISESVHLFIGTQNMQGSFFFRCSFWFSSLWWISEFRNAFIFCADQFANSVEIHHLPETHLEMCLTYIQVFSELQKSSPNAKNSQFVHDCCRWVCFHNAPWELKFSGIISWIYSFWATHPTQPNTHNTSQGMIENMENK